MNRTFIRTASTVALVTAAQSGVHAQSVASLLDLSLEQLANIEVTSFAKRSQRLADVAGSVYVISSEDIRRSGATSIAEVLRLAPNLHVGRADANQYAISARGFNSVLANKMLVLIDGRTVYSPLFSGVFWEERDLMLEDIERIEVLSGSGGTLYGSNAVNGVINIISRSAAETQGTLLTVSAGNQDRVAGARYGGTTSSGLAYRVYAKRSERENTELANGTPVRDASDLSRAGFRMDRSDAGRQWSLQGDIYESRIEQAPAPSTRHLHGTNLLGRWAQDSADGARSQLQVYYAHTERNQPGSVRDKLDTLDFDFQHLTRSFKGHELLWGGGYRWQQDDVENISPTLAFIPPNRRLNLTNVFVQDEIALGDALKVTLGAKAERNVYTGIEFLPNARVAWNVLPNHLLWAAASRTVRVPSRVDREFFTPPTPPFALAGGPNFQSEVAKVIEAGYRAQPFTALSYSVTLFHHDFDRLRSVDPMPGGATLNNNFEGRLNGLEAWGTWRVSDRWRINASTVHLREKFTVKPGATPIGGTSQLANDPRSRWTLGSAFDLGSGHEVDVTARHVGTLPVGPVPAYTAIDARWGWNVKPGLIVSLTLRNIGDPRHPEWGAPASRAEIERSMVVKATWRL